MLNLDYDRDFFSTAFLPLCYLLSMLFINANVVRAGPGALSVMAAYCFRMCVLPIVLALGNFYLEPCKFDYIHKYNLAILLMCIENLLVFVALLYYTNYYDRKLKTNVRIDSRNIPKHYIIKWAIAILSFFLLLTLIMNLELKNYYLFITSGIDSVFRVDELRQIGPSWYLFDFIANIWRPLISFTLLYSLSKKLSKINIVLIILIMVINIVVVSDRRIYSLLIGIACFYQLLPIINTKKIKILLTIALLSLIVLSLKVFFYDAHNAGADWLLARTFQRYFSGPTLTAMALEINEQFGIQFFDFFKILLNTSFMYSGVFGKISLPDYYYSIFGPGSKSIWTPMTAGSIRYFSIFFPLIIIFIVRYIAKLDYEIKKTNDRLYKTIYTFIAVAISVYMVMYSIHLIIYYIIVFIVIYHLLIALDSKKWVLRR
jgi:hypothetical protein